MVSGGTIVLGIVGLLYVAKIAEGLFPSLQIELWKDSADKKSGEKPETEKLQNITGNNDPLFDQTSADYNLYHSDRG